MPPAPATFAQITNHGQTVQGKKAQITIKQALAEAIGQDSEIGEASGSVRSAYLHVPFCFHKCHYCDFYSIVDSKDRQEVFVDRMVAELDVAAAKVRVPLATMFVGGGTPTLLRPELWSRLLSSIERFRDANTEFTVEANPETVTDELIDILVSRGVNRISIGCQSFNAQHLKTLERWHDPRNVHRSVEIIRRQGVHNFNLDLIFGIPGQTLSDWKADLDEALSLNPTHLSCYGLTYEPNTALTMKMKAGSIEPIDEDIEAAMYEMTIDRLAAAGFEHYEVSNWARRSKDGAQRCRHNMQYWTNQNWWPIGPSASGHFEGRRWKNVPRLAEYLEHGPWPLITDFEHVDQDGRAGEEMMLGLRLIEGLSITQLDRLLAMGMRGDARRQAVTQALEQGLLCKSDGGIRFTRSGLLQADTVIAQFI